MQGVRKAHSACDNSNRKFAAMVAKSSSHDNTKGCKSEKDLQTIIDECKIEDDKLVHLEAKYLQGKSLDDNGITHGAEVANMLMAKLKEGSKKMAALRPWFKL